MKTVCLLFISLSCIFFSSCLYGAVIQKEYFSIDLPEGWIITKETERHLNIVSPMEQGVSASIEINTYNVSDSSEDILLEMFSKPLRDMGIEIGEAIQTKEGYSILPLLTQPGGCLLAGLKDNRFDSIMMFGFHHEIKNVLQSLRLFKKRPYLLEMSKLAISIIDKAMEIK